MPGFGSVGPWEIILILAVLLLLFGAKRLPEIGAALGKGIREFKGSVRDIEKEIHRPDDRRGDLPRSDAPRSDAPRSDAPRSDAPRSDAPRSDAPRSDAPRAEPGPDAARTGESAPSRDDQLRDARPPAPEREPRDS